MNCKPGDLAYTVAASAHAIAIRNGGRFVEVVRYRGTYVFAGGLVRNDVWVCKVLGPPMPSADGRLWSGEVFISDRNLRPIRPGDISDEEVRDLYAPKQPEAA